MKLFGQLVRTVVNVAALPIAAVVDVVKLGDIANKHESSLKKAIEKLKDEADED